MKLDPRIKAYIDEPSYEGWDGIYSLKVNATTTLWAAVIQVSPAFPRSCGKEAGMRPRDRWRTIPSPGTIFAALREATKPPRKKTWLERLGLTRKRKCEIIAVESDAWDQVAGLKKEWKNQKAISLSDDDVK